MYRLIQTRELFFSAHFKVEVLQIRETKDRERPEEGVMLEGHILPSVFLPPHSDPGGFLQVRGHYAAAVHHPLRHALSRLQPVFLNTKGKYYLYQISTLFVRLKHPCRNTRASLFIKSLQPVHSPCGHLKECTSCRVSALKVPGRRQ